MGITSRVRIKSNVGTYCVPCPDNCCACNLEGKCTKCCVGYVAQNWECVGCNSTTCSCSALGSSVIVRNSYAGKIMMVCSLAMLIASEIM